MQAVTAIILAVSAALAITIALAVWPTDDPGVTKHNHVDLPPNHPHLVEAGHDGSHAHAYVIDDMHAVWPTQR